MRVETIETKRLYLRRFQKEDAVFAISIWNDPKMGEYLPDEAMDEIDEAYLKEIEDLSEDEVCCYMIAEFKDTHERVGTCSFIASEDGKVYDIAYIRSIGETDMLQKWQEEWWITLRDTAPEK